MKEAEVESNEEFEISRQKIKEKSLLSSSLDEELSEVEIMASPTLSPAARRPGPKLLIQDKRRLIFLPLSIWPLASSVNR